MVEVAKLEISAWKGPVKDMALIILFCFIHRWTTGKSVEESFNTQKRELDYQI